MDQESVTVVKENQSNETVDNNNEEESIDRLTTSSSQEQQQESQGDTFDDQAKQKSRRDSGLYPPNWTLLLNQKESRPPPLAGITEVRMHLCIALCQLKSHV